MSFISRGFPVFLLIGAIVLYVAGLRFENEDTVSFAMLLIFVSIFLWFIMTFSKYSQAKKDMVEKDAKGKD